MHSVAWHSYDKKSINGTPQNEDYSFTFSTTLRRLLKQKQFLIDIALYFIEVFTRTAVGASDKVLPYTLDCCAIET